MPYSTVPDLLIGDLMLGSSVDPASFVQNAADEMDSKLGFIYTVPINVDAAGFPVYQKTLLKQINNNLASGQILLATTQAEEQASLHAYGLSLVQQARNDLMLIANGTVDLAAPRNVTSPDESYLAPSIQNLDEEPLTQAFEETVMRGRKWWTQPGKVT